MWPGYIILSEANLMFQFQITSACESNLLPSVREDGWPVRWTSISRMPATCRLDDPLMWGVLPLRYAFNPSNMRWGLGAHDICYKNK